MEQVHHYNQADGEPRIGERIGHYSMELSRRNGGGMSDNIPSDGTVERPALENISEVLFS
jgi:hypothetical protein